MTWNSLDWGGVQRTRVNQHKIWTPDIYLQEDINQDMAIGDNLYIISSVILLQAPETFNSAFSRNLCCNSVELAW